MISRDLNHESGNESGMSSDTAPPCPVSPVVATALYGRCVQRRIPTRLALRRSPYLIQGEKSMARESAYRSTSSRFTSGSSMAALEIQKLVRMTNWS